MLKYIRSEGTIRIINIVIVEKTKYLSFVIT